MRRDSSLLRLVDELVEQHRVDLLVAHSLEEAKNLAGKVLRQIQDWLGDAEIGKNLASLSNQFAATATFKSSK